MSGTRVSWEELLSPRLGQVTNLYGPHSQSVFSAFAVICDIEWLEHVGDPVTDSGIVVVQSWEDALIIFGGDRRYNANGVLRAPCDRVDPVLERMPERESWWQKAREDVKPYTALYGWPDDMSRANKDLMFENLYEFVSMLLAEIIGSPEAECTYFREQLSWFHAGHFPCGWEGNWPNGRMRVF